ncbi:hypothetical protein M9H77_17490 [Catharanthus roseus]|uniref:Uncharacterized protein n=1 Tax=Catharanthus roseus TaxID=4058 RepID=A0ACC0B4R2_CATRO|nr:hypothetical protein M9H77_17490 [Catharanthus roseus]
MQKFWKQNMENEKNLDCHIYKTMSFFTPTSYLCLKHFLMETKLNSFALTFDRILLNLLEILLKDFENQRETYYEMCKANPLTFEKSILRKEIVEQVCKEFVFGHLYRHKLFRE